MIIKYSIYLAWTIWCVVFLTAGAFDYHARGVISLLVSFILALVAGWFLGRLIEETRKS